MQPPDASDPGADSDRALMARVSQGDEAALGALMARWELPTKAVVARLVLNAHEAEDLAQEAFVKVWQHRADFRAEAEFRPWLFSIAVNLARNRLRWWRRRPVIALEEWTESAAVAADGSGASVHGWKAADGALGAPPAAGAAALEGAERAAAVREAVAALPAHLREALVLFEYEQMSHAEIATVVGASAKAVETRIYRAKEKLRARLRPLQPA